MVNDQSIRNEASAPPPTGAQQVRWGRLMTQISWLYVGAILATLIVVHTGGDRWWPATLLMFSPRWVFVFPLVMFLPIVIFARRRALWPLGIGLAVILGPLMGLCLPWRPLIGLSLAQQRIRVLSCNVHFNDLHAEALCRLISLHEPDLVVLQGWLDKHKTTVFGKAKWHLRRDGELCLASRYPIQRVEVASDPTYGRGQGNLARYDLEMPSGTIHLFNLHLASPREALQTVVDGPLEAAPILQANSELRRSQSEIIRKWTREANGPVLLAGDFNMPTDSTIYRQCWSCFHNGFSEAGFGWGYTYFTRRAAVRIDHQLGGPGWQCRKCWVGPNIGSPHRPVIADWEYTAQED
jgi:endonuclease/exonuclease/phosphatase (EEP) superfamily protein YafD